jgi:serine phosphatase RsbU (regulator of sigma subunit)
MSISNQNPQGNGRRVPTILVVDDESLVTKTLSSYLQLETEYDVLAFESPLEALKAVKVKAPDLVISDFLMPEMDGLKFLSEIKKLYPDISTILLTGYADKENAIKAINQVGLFQYLEKPWDNENLKLVIRNGIMNKDLKILLKDKIKEFDQILLERDKLAEHNEMLTEQLLLARNVQESMLPQSFPNSGGISIVAKYLPALEIGGDFYDVVPLANHHLALLIADVTGHGIQSALITVLLKFAFSGFKDTTASPGEILSSMNKILFNVLPRGFYVAAMVVTIDLLDGHCRLVNGGVPYPYLVRVRERLVEHVPANGLLLGVADGELYQPGNEVAVKLQKGDRLLLYTDGLSETENSADMHFDDGLMMQTLTEVSQKSTAEILEHLALAAQRFSKPEHHWDDVTILGIESN